VAVLLVVLPQVLVGYWLLLPELVGKGLTLVTVMMVLQLRALVGKGFKPLLHYQYIHKKLANCGLLNFIFVATRVWCHVARDVPKCTPGRGILVRFIISPG
jgi:hypothetical protein